RGTDLNRRPPGYEPGELPNCSTPRWDLFSSHRCAAHTKSVQVGPAERLAPPAQRSVLLGVLSLDELLEDLVQFDFRVIVCGAVTGFPGLVLLIEQLTCAVEQLLSVSVLQDRPRSRRGGLLFLGLLCGLVLRGSRFLGVGNRCLLLVNRGGVNFVLDRFSVNTSTFG